MCLVGQEQTPFQLQKPIYLNKIDCNLISSTCMGLRLHPPAPFSFSYPYSKPNESGTGQNRRLCYPHSVRYHECPLVGHHRRHRLHSYRRHSHDRLDYGFHKHVFRVDTGRHADCSPTCRLPIQTPLDDTLQSRLSRVPSTSMSTGAASSVGRPSRKVCAQTSTSTLTSTSTAVPRTSSFSRPPAMSLRGTAPACHTTRAFSWSRPRLVVPLSTAASWEPALSTKPTFRNPTLVITYQN
jgi:hypothetical protein